MNYMAYRERAEALARGWWDRADVIPYGSHVEHQDMLDLIAVVEAALREVVRDRDVAWSKSPPAPDPDG